MMTVTYLFHVVSMLSLALDISGFFLRQKDPATCAAVCLNRAAGPRQGQTNCIRNTSRGAVGISHGITTTTTLGFVMLSQLMGVSTKYHVVAWDN